MKIQTENTTTKLAVFTREELLEKLGIDLRDFYYASLNFHEDTLVLHYHSDGK